MLAPIQGKNIGIYPTTCYYPMSFTSQRALTLLWAFSRKLRVEIASWHYHPGMKIREVWNQNLVEDENYLLPTCQAYKVSEKYDNLFDGHDNLCLSSNPHHDGWAHMAKDYFHTANVYSREVNPYLIDDERTILFFQVHHYTQVVRKQTFPDPPYCQNVNTDHN